MSFPYTNEETGLDDFDQPIYAADTDRATWPATPDGVTEPSSRVGAASSQTSPDAVPSLFAYYDADTYVVDSDGYPGAWPALKHAVREQVGHRCVRCKHPYRVGMHGSGEWSPCDMNCLHGEPTRLDYRDGEEVREAQWRILTVHHLDGDKRNCRWWNLVPLCQRCHLTIQGKVVMDRPYDRPHTNWFQPYVAGFYAHKYLDQDLPLADVMARLEELLLLELRQDRLFPL